MDAAAPPTHPTPPCDALELLPPDLWMHALEQFEEKRDVVHAAACCRSLVPMAGVGNMLNWELFNSWYKEEYVARGKGVVEGELLACDGLGPEVLSARGRFMLQTGGGCTLGNPGVPSGAQVLYFHHPHAFVIQGPATAGDMLSALMQQFARERARNTIFEQLLEHIQYKVDFVIDPEGPLKDPDGPVFRRVMVDSDEGDWAAGLIKTLGLTDGHLFESFAKNLIPPECISSCGFDFPVTLYGDSRPADEDMDLLLGITDPDPTVTMSTEDLVDLASNYQYDDLCCAFERLEPADSSEAPAGFVRRLAGEPGQRAFRAVWSDRYV